MQVALRAACQRHRFPRWKSSERSGGRSVVGRSLRVEASRTGCRPGRLHGAARGHSLGFGAAY